MTCASCVHAIESGLMKHIGVIEAKVALATERGKVKFDPNKLGKPFFVQQFASNPCHFLYCI